jgi:cold shock CspA family protein
MGKSQQTFGKKEREKKKQKKREEKARRKQERLDNNMKGAGLDSMVIPVDEYGTPITEPQDPNAKKEEVNAEDIVLGIPKKDKTEEDSKKTGKLAFANYDKGYGFISDSASGEKYFVHFSNVIGEEPNENDKVEFEIEKGPRGWSAIQVKKI